MSDLQRYFGEKWDAEDATEKLYLTHDLRPDAVVLDVGGYHGDWSFEIWRRHAGINLHIFEPISEYSLAIRERFKQHGRVEVHPFGLASRNAFRSIYKHGQGSSIYLEGPSNETIELRDIATETLKILNVQNMCDVNIDLIAINIEGGEYDLLTCMLDSGLAYQCKEIMVQFHPLWPSSFDERKRLRNWLLQTHEEVWSYPFIWEKWRRR